MSTRSSKRPSHSRVKPIKKAATAKSASKQSNVLKLLSRPAGATVEKIADATGWQPHSVRGFLAGVVRKKLNLNLTSEVIGANRVYKIAQKPPAKS